MLWPGFHAITQPYETEEPTVDWFELTGKYHELTFDHDARLDSLPEPWQREMAALWRLEADVNNGGYLQFLANWGIESYRYGIAALRHIGAQEMAGIVADAHETLSNAVDLDGMSSEELDSLMPNPMIDWDGTVIKEAGSILSDEILEKLNDLDFRFMDYPDDLAELGLKYYTPFLTSE